MTEHTKIDERKDIIARIEENRKSKLLVYFMGDRQIIPANMAHDSVRWFYDHLINMCNGDSIPQIDLFIYSRGGALEVPWQIITTIRQFCDKLHVLIPYKAYSAATLLALGADKIFMGRKGELGPIDPHMASHQNILPGSPPQIVEFSVEDITSYIGFLKEKVGLTDQRSLSLLTNLLAEKLSPMTLGQVNRVHSHIRIVAGKMLSLVNPPLDNVVINKIVESLTEKIYVHGHSIGFDEAKQIGMQVEYMDRTLENECWNLFLKYEELMKLNYPNQPQDYIEDGQEEYIENDAVIACIESLNKYHECSGQLQFKVKRHFPQPINFNLNMPLQLPPNINFDQLPLQIQEILQQITQNFQNIGLAQMRSIIEEQIRNQSTIVGVDVITKRLMWKEIPQKS
jgi:hypothetical protein